MNISPFKLLMMFIYQISARECYRIDYGRASRVNGRMTSKKGNYSAEFDLKTWIVSVGESLVLDEEKSRKSGKNPGACDFFLATLREFPTDSVQKKGFHGWKVAKIMTQHPFPSRARREWVLGAKKSFMFIVGTIVQG